MMISGPDGTVPLFLSTAGGTTHSGGSVFVDTSLQIFGTIDGSSSGLSYAACSYSSTACTSSPSFSSSGTHTFETGDLYQIVMFASVRATNGIGSAWIDPFFSAPDGFTITLSDNIGNLPLSGSVPEPSTWAMIILGFAGVGFMAYRRNCRSRTDVVFAAA